MSTESQSNFKSHDFALRAQKKILGQFTSRKAAKAFISDNLYKILDHLYQLVKSHTHDKKIAEKFVKNTIKLSIKIGLLVQNDQFTPSEIATANKMSDKFRNIVMTITSFTEVDYSYDRSFLQSAVNQFDDMLTNLVKDHLTDKSIQRIKSVASQLRDPALLDAAFKKGTPENDIIIKMVAEINQALESGEL